MQENEHDIFIHPDGTIRFVYKDELQSLLSMGKTKLKRASHILPIETEAGWQFNADLSPSGGPLLGPFETYEKAIEAEVQWLHENWTTH